MPTLKKTEFLPYVFQIFAAILEQKPAGNFDQNWLLLVEPLITPALWDIRGYAPGLARLLAALVPHAKGWIIEKNQVEPILGIFQKLMAGRARTELYSFDVLESLIVSLDT